MTFFFFHLMSKLSGLKVLTLFEGFAVGGRSVEVYLQEEEKRGGWEAGRDSFSGSVEGNFVCIAQFTDR